MAGHNEIYTTTVKLNSEEAKNRLMELSKTVENLKKQRSEALQKGNMPLFDHLGKELKKAEREMRQFKSDTMNVADTLKNLDAANIRQIEKAMRSVRAQMKQTSNAEDFKRLALQLQSCKDRIAEIKAEGEKATGETRKLTQGMEALRSVMSNLGTSSLAKLQETEAYLKKVISTSSPTSTSYSTAIAQLREVQGRILQITQEQKRLNQTIDQYDDEIKQAAKDTATVEREMKLINGTLKNLDHSSVAQIEYSIKIINEQLRHMDHGTEEFRQMTNQAKRLRTELAKIRYEGAAQQSWVNRMADWFNKMQGMAISFMATVTGLSLTIRKSVADYAAMDQEMVNVQKYTGQAKKEVEEMNETFKKMNTRTPREQLNQLAGDAGKLGITTKQAIEEFVDGADKINVALGDDLGENAVKDVGKLAHMFGEDEKKGLRGAMLATGSAVNELAQNSSASAGYLVDFTARVSGVGKQAHLTQQQIMGFASVLDQNMQQDETSATAFQNLLTKMFQEPAKFAKLAGKNVKEFSNLLKTDANEALLQFLGAMKKQGGFDKLAPMFEQMNLDGSRATGVLSVMADKLADIKTAQDLANKAYNDGTSVVKEFNTQMSSEQAKLDMASKAFKEMSIQLGKELLPVARYTIFTGSTLAKVLFNIISFTKEHIWGLTKLAAVMTLLGATYKAGTIKVYLWYVKEHALLALHKLHIIAIKAKVAAIGTLKVAYYLLTGNLTKAKAAMEAMRAASLTNPYTAMLTVVLALAAGIYAVIKAFNALSDAGKKNELELRKQQAVLKDMRDAQKSVNESTAETKMRIERLTNIINSNVYSLGERKNAMIALEKEVPAYHRNLNNEATLTQANNKALKEYVDRLNDAAMAQALYNRMVELQGKEFDLKQEIARHNLSAKAVKAEINRHPEYYNATYDKDIQVGTGGLVRSITVKGLPTDANVAKHKELQMWVDLTKKTGDNLQVVQKRIAAINEYMDKNKGVREQYNQLVEKRNAKDGVPPDWNPNQNKPGKLPDKKAERAKSAAERKAEAERKKRMAKELKEAKAHTDLLQAQNILAYHDLKITHREYIENQHKIAKEGYEKQIAIYKKYHEEYRQLTDEIARENLREEEDKIKLNLADIERRRQRELAEAQADFRNASSEIYLNEEALNERLFEIDMSAMADRVEALKEGSEEWLSARADMEQAEREHMIDREQHFAELLAHYREQWGRRDIKEQETIALNGLEALYKAKRIKEKEYQEILRAIRLQYAEEEAEQNRAHSKREVTARNAHSAYRVAADKAEAEAGEKSGVGIGEYIFGSIGIYQSTMSQLKKMYQSDEITFEEYQQAKSEAAGRFAEDITAKTQAAYDSINTIMSAASSYYSSQATYEQAVTSKKYDKMIAAAGNNSAKSKKLEEQKQKELAKIKTKYNKKAMKIELAQATATMLLGAMKAYTSAWEGSPYPANLVLAPIAAGIALAAGMMNLASIKKQHATEEVGYYEGGFTGGHNYRKRAGVVHEGEFVINHAGVNNANLMPVIRLIDQAQRSNTVGALTSTDVSRQLGAGTSAVVAPVVNVTNDNEEMRSTIDRVDRTMDKLNRNIEDGITAVVSVTGRNGIRHNLDMYDKMMDNK